MYIRHQVFVVEPLLPSSPYLPSRSQCRSASYTALLHVIRLLYLPVHIYTRMLHTSSCVFKCGVYIHYVLSGQIVTARSMVALYLCASPLWSLLFRNLSKKRSL